MIFSKCVHWLYQFDILAYMIENMKVTFFLPLLQHTMKTLLTFIHIFVNNDAICKPNSIFAPPFHNEVILQCILISCSATKILPNVKQMIDYWSNRHYCILEYILAPAQEYETELPQYFFHCQLAHKRYFLTCCLNLKFSFDISDHITLAILLWNCPWSN